MYNTAHNFKSKTNNPVVSASFNNSFNLSHNVGVVQVQDKKLKKYSTNSRKHVKQGAYSSYTNMTKKHPRASSHKKTSHTSNSKQEEHLNKSAQKKKNILFRLANELSQSPDTVKVHKAYGKESKKKAVKANVKASIFQKVVPSFGILGD